MAKFRATVTNYRGVNEVSLQMNDRRQTIEIAPKAEGYGSGVSGAELLFLALATCYCNDLYREAAKRGIQIERVEVQVDGDFEREGGAATNVTYRGRVKAGAGKGRPPGPDAPYRYGSRDPEHAAGGNAGGAERLRSDRIAQPEPGEHGKRSCKPV